MFQFSHPTDHTLCLDPSTGEPTSDHGPGGDSNGGPGDPHGGPCAPDGGNCQPVEQHSRRRHSKRR